MPILKKTARPITTRRTFFQQSGMSMAGIALAGSAKAEQASLDRVRIGYGDYTYELVQNWGSLPSIISLGMGAGVVVDSSDNVYALGCGGSGVVVFDRKGRFLRCWGSEFAASAHSLHIAKEGRNEFLYITESGRGLVTKTTLDGKHVLSIGRGAAAPFQLNQPAATAVAPNGDIYVCEGYGDQRVLRFNSSGKFIQSIGELGDGQGEFNICHGITVDTRRKEIEICIADRENNRIQIFTPDLKWKRTLTDGVFLPSAFCLNKQLLFMTSQYSGIAIFDNNGQIVRTLGNIRSQTISDDPSAFILPHDAAVDSYGDLYVIEWVLGARLRKFCHAPQPI